MNYLDILISIIQNISFIYIIYFCLNMKKNGNEKKIILFLIILSANVIFIPKIFQSILVGIFLTHTCALIIVYLFIKLNYREALISYSLVYLIGSTLVFIFGNILYGILEQYFLSDYIKIVMAMLMYGSQAILLPLCYMYRSKIKQIYKILLNEDIPIKVIVFVSFIPDFLTSFYFISYAIDSSSFGTIVYSALFIFLIITIVFFIKIIRRANEINRLNRTLTIKNAELKKIKNDYGLQMSCLYELVNMKRYDDTVRFLKSVINQNDPNTNNENSKQSSLLSLATGHATKEGINVIIEDTANFKLTTIAEIELYRIIINIVNNAIRAMRNSGTLIAKSFQDLEDIVIIIENDGEKIPEEIIDKIFDSGFTTKHDNDKNHGYGLCIAKELIEKHCGKIFVESNDNITKFTINLPIT
ncbi:MULTISPECIES: ATP-binding protein [unclassified Clostridium]|uniref:ATP-binding protein n=1 Tax=unclassified Clostridium TaxID=2614128 RepID=UPI0002974692|nr:MULTISPECIES: ATP-binding protein [unclassified Clostridium]EKQ57215.1 MAG: histidine kinase [Clostridium sp. Maddingley MBC34-26]